MPQATDKLRDKMRERFMSMRHELDPVTVVDCGEVEEWLVKQGWKSTRGGVMYSPTTLGKMSEAEYDAMLYLRDEWDYAYGGPI